MLIKKSMIFHHLCQVENRKDPNIFFQKGTCFDGTFPAVWECFTWKGQGDWTSIDFSNLQQARWKNTKNLFQSRLFGPIFLVSLQLDWLKQNSETHPPAQRFFFSDMYQPFNGYQPWSTAHDYGTCSEKGQQKDCELQHRWWIVDSERHSAFCGNQFSYNYEPFKNL